jgi:hypothetical protein
LAGLRLREEEVLPLEDARLHEDAKPIQSGKEVFDDKKVRRRREATVGKVVAGGARVVVLGESQDLSEQVRRQAPACEYVRVWVRHFPE